MKLLVRKPAKPSHQLADVDAPPLEPDSDDRFDDKRVKVLFLGVTRRGDEQDEPTLYFLMTPRNVNFDGSAQPDHATYFAMTPTAVTATAWDEAVPIYATDQADAIHVKVKRREESLPFKAKRHFFWKLFDQELESQIIDLWAGTVIKRLFKDHKQRAAKMYRKMHEEFCEYFDSTQLLERDGHHVNVIWPSRTKLLIGYALRLSTPVLFALAYLLWDLAIGKLYGNGGFPWLMDLCVYPLVAADLYFATKRMQKERLEFCV